MITWGEYRTQIRRSVLKDPDGNTWDDESLLDFCWWALDTFCAHTAAASSINYAGATGSVFALPVDLYESIEETGLLYLKSSENLPRIIYLEPSDFPALSSELTFQTLNGEIHLSEDLPENFTLHLNYFAYYPHPQTDADPITIPRWALGPVSYLIGAFALGPVGVQSANISQWKDRSDSGQPENNALRVQHKFFLDIYERELQRYPKQIRTSYWKKYR